MKRINIKAVKFLILIAVAILIICLGVAIGTVNVSVLDILKTIFKKLLGMGSQSLETDIILNIRLPRVLLAFLVGASLSVGGVVIQSVLKNPLATPYTIGVSSGASLAVSIVIILGISVPFLGVFFKPIVGFLAAIASVFSIIAFTYAIDKTTTSNTIVLTGMVISLFYSSIQTLITAISHSDIKQVILWQMGSFGLRGWEFVFVIFLFFIFGVFLLMFLAKELDVLTFGDDQAKSIGVEAKKVTILLLTVSAILTGASVAACGIIGFVDLVTPYIARRIFGSKHIYVVPSSAIIGGSIMVLADLISRTAISPAELPVGAVTAFIGAPFFGYIYLIQNKRG